MRPTTLAEIEAAIRAACGTDTCSPDDLDAWSLDNPTRGHCAVAALVVHDLFGGDLLGAEVHRGGVHIGHHWWNRVHGIDIDLTLEQFDHDEIVLDPTVHERPAGGGPRYEDQYQVFRRRVEGLLHSGPGSTGSELGSDVGLEASVGVDPGLV
ncbi:MAG: hypothetical protein ABJH68_17950 [Ilumatobacter sp.]|uniref:YunG family protein n=1 Tax=Ilumatobacter sp. TaxID=1967498 RepID=UPI00329A2860